MHALLIQYRYKTMKSLMFKIGVEYNYCKKKININIEWIVLNPFIYKQFKIHYKIYFYIFMVLIGIDKNIDVRYMFGFLIKLFGTTFF